MPPRQQLQHQLCQSLTTRLPHLRATTPPVLAGLAVGLSFAEAISLPAIAADAPFSAKLPASTASTASTASCSTPWLPASSAGTPCCRTCSPPRRRPR